MMDHTKKPTHFQWMIPALGPPHQKQTRCFAGLAVFSVAPNGFVLYYENKFYNRVNWKKGGDYMKRLFCMILSLSLLLCCLAGAAGE